MNNIKKHITVSLIAPIYGVEPYIAQFAESVLGQSYPHIQYIFVNDGTKDASMEILEKVINERFVHRREQIVIVNQPNGGLPAARHIGLQYATGDYIYHIDSDDWLQLNSVERIVSKIEETGSDIIYFNFIKEYIKRPKKKREHIYTIEDKELYLSNMCNHKAFGYVWNKCVRRSLYTSHNVYTPRCGYAEDTFLMLQLIGYADSISYLDEYLYHYRRDNPNALTSQERRKRKREYAINAIGLYEKYSNMSLEKCPIASVMEDMIIQAGWYSVFYRLNLFKKHPNLAETLRKTKFSCSSDVPLLAQLFTKICVLLKRGESSQ